MINTDSLSDMIEKHIKTAVDTAVQTHISEYIENMALDNKWVSKIENLVNQNFVQKISRQISTIDLNKAIVDEIDAGIERWQQRYLENLKTTGITDTATEPQVTIEDGVVAVKDQLVSLDLHVANSAFVEGDAQVRDFKARCITVDDFVVRGTVNVDNQCWDVVAANAADKMLSKLTQDWKDELVQQVLERAKNGGIDFNEVLVAGRSLVNGNQLSSLVTESKLQSVGVLRDLRVHGETSLADTLHVSGRRVGINTERPEMALSVWDEEVTVVAGKRSQNTAFVGTSRQQALTIGVNRNANIEIDVDGLVTIKKLRLDRFNISHSAQVPGWSGTRGDWVFNSDPKPDQPFAWVCLGAFRWQALKAV